MNTRRSERPSVRSERVAVSIPTSPRQVTSGATRPSHSRTPRRLASRLLERNSVRWLASAGSPHSAVRRTIRSAAWRPLPQLVRDSTSPWSGPPTGDHARGLSAHVRQAGSALRTAAAKPGVHSPPRCACLPRPPPSHRANRRGNPGGAVGVDSPAGLESRDESTTAPAMFARMHLGDVTPTRPAVPASLDNARSEGSRRLPSCEAPAARERHRCGARERAARPGCPGGANP